MFDWGKSYLLTDRKELVFENEPAVCVGKHDSDSERPTVCAVCGEPLRSKDYYCFHMMGPKGYGYDMMIGGGCIRERIKATKLDIEREHSPMETLKKLIIKFPQSGRWYGTFLHHCIAKPYVRDRKIAERWDESVLKLPGVRFIMSTIDSLLAEGWNLDAEMHLDCGNVDLLATHAEKGTLVFDWKSDLCFSNKEAYVAQINRYMAELYTDGHQNISGYILWVRNGNKEYVPFRDVPEIFVETKPHVYVPSPRIKCTLKIDLGGGEGIAKKSITEYCYHRKYGDEVFFFIPSCQPKKHGYKFANFEASPYREDEHPQYFDVNDAEEGLRLTFICTKKRRTFYLKAEWNRIRPFNCTMWINVNNGSRFHSIVSKSVLGEDGKDYAEFDTAEISRKIPNILTAKYITMPEGGNIPKETVWKKEDLAGRKKIRIPCDGDETTFSIYAETEKEKVEKQNIAKPKSIQKNEPSEPLSDAWNDYFELLKKDPQHASHHVEHVSPPVQELSILQENHSYQSYERDYDQAEHTFLPGRVYKSGSKYYGIYKRKTSDRPNACGMVDVAEVGSDGRKISNLEWRHVYETSSGKEYFYGLSDTKWKIYTSKVLVGIEPGEMNRFGQS